MGLEKHKGRLEELDALRGLAALVVVLFHYSTRYDAVYGHLTPLGFSVPWGHYGVQLFFMISGFVIFMTLDRTGRALDFVVSRFARLFPTYWVAILATTLVVHLGAMEGLQVSPAAVAANFSMLQSWFGIASVDGVYWTLTVELCFYAVMFGIFLAGQLGRIEAILVGWIALKWLWAFAPVTLSWALGALLIQEYIPFFALGIVLFLVWARRISLGRAGGLIGLALLTIAVIDGVGHLVTALVGLALFGLIIAQRLAVLRAPPLMFLGSISYALYLLHENIGWTILFHLERWGVPAAVAVAVALGVVVLLAQGLTYKIEKPAIAAIRTWWRGVSC